MSNDAGGFDPRYPPPPVYPPPGYGQPGPYPPPQQGYPPTSYPPPGYPPPGYTPPGYGPPGYSQMPAALKPGIIPLRPLSLTDIFNGAFAYVRMNPKATLGLTTIVVVVAQLVSLVLQIGPLTAMGELTNTFSGDVDALSTAGILGLSLSSLAGGVMTVLSAIVLSGLLTVVVGRAVFGATITIGEAWQRVRGRLLALFGILGIQAVGAVLIIGVVIGVIAMIAYIIGGAAAFVIGVPLSLLAIAALIYFSTMLIFTPALIVLERLPVLPAITRSFALVKKDFWRVLGIWLLGSLVAGIIAGAVSVPFSLGGQLMLFGAASGSATVVALVLMSVGAAIGQIITSPFTAGVVVLLYADRRIRAEAFDLVLQTGAVNPTNAPSYSTDHLWLTSQTPHV